MNVQELHARLQEIIDEGNGDMTIFVHALTGGISGSGHAGITGVAYGFDWDNGKVLVHTDQTLLGAAYAEKRRESARKAGERDAKRKS